MSIGVALVGSGIFAKEEHLPAILAARDLSLKAVYSRSLKSAATLSENLAQTIHLYSDDTKDQGRSFEDMLKDINIKAVIIANTQELMHSPGGDPVFRLPITSQPPYIKAAMDAGKHVLAEKPIAKDVKTATELLQWYRSSVDTNKVTWSVAENWRFLDSHLYAAEEVRKLGRVLGFRVKVNSMVKPGNKYFETAWRKTPEYQGGFLLDGGVHFVAAIRLMLGPENDITRVSAFTTKLQEHLPPIDTVNAIMKTKTGISGTFSVSFGTTAKGSGYTIACEHGTVTVLRSQVVIQKDGHEQTKHFSDEGSGVNQEVSAWSKGLAIGTNDIKQSPEEALKDLIVLESAIKSGENDGAPVSIST